jgi:hypothetical protein
VAKLKEGVFVGPDIRKLMFDEFFLLTKTEVEKEAWISLKSVVTKFLGEQRRPCLRYDCCKYAGKIKKKLGCLLSLKIHFLNFHLDFSRKSWYSE